MRHNDYPTTLLMEPAANNEPSRYRMTPAASTVREMAQPKCSRAEFQRRMAVERFEYGDHAPSMQWIGVDVAGGPGTAAVVTCTSNPGHFGGADDPLFKFAETESASGATLIGTKTDPEAEVWHTEAPTVCGVYIADEDSCVRYRPEEAARWHRYWNGKSFSNAWLQTSPKEEMERMRASPSAASIQWLRLIEADTHAPAAQESAKPHVDRALNGTCWYIDGKWYPCDADGWISHTPTADAVCPVPECVKFDAKWCDGDVMFNVPFGTISVWRKMDGDDAAFVAWRPIQA